MKQQFTVWKEDVQPVLISKVEEFHLLGYDRVTVNEIWECILYKLRKQKDFIRIHQFVNMIMTLKVNDYMTWLTIGAYQGPNWFDNHSPIDLE